MFDFPTKICKWKSGLLENDKSLIVAPTIKANGYGLGDKKLFKLFKKNKVKHFFVATLKEGINLDNKDKSIKIYVLNGIQNYDVKIFIKNNLIPIINSVSELKIINKYKSKFGLHIDTGINRLGIDYKNVPNNVYKNKNIQIVLSHFVKIALSHFVQIALSHFVHLVHFVLTRIIVYIYDYIYI